MTKKEPESVNPKKLNECFIITPIGKPNSETFKKTEGLLDTILTPILERFDYKPVPAHRIDSTGSITKQIISKVVGSELVIANLTGVNPNVMYEVAIRHSFGKKIIIVAEEGTVLPFDIQDQRIIFYEDSLFGAEYLKRELSSQLSVLTKEEDSESEKKSPVYESIQVSAALNTLPLKDREFYTIVLNKINNLENVVMRQGRRSERHDRFFNERNRPGFNESPIQLDILIDSSSDIRNVSKEVRDLLLSNRVQVLRYKCFEKNIRMITLPREDFPVDFITDLVGAVPAVLSVEANQM